MVRRFLLRILCLLGLLATPAFSIATSSYSLPNYLIPQFNPQPYRDYLITTSQPLPTSSAALGGLHLPQRKENLLIGKVIAVGSHKIYKDKSEDMKIKKDEYVGYSTEDIPSFKVNGITHDIIQEKNILLKCSSLEPTFNGFNCFNENILVEILPSTDQSPSTSRQILLPNVQKKKYTLGTVVKSCQEDCFIDGMKVNVSPGTRILIANDSETHHHQISLEGKNYQLIPVKDVVASL